MVLASIPLDPLEGRKAQFRHKCKHMQRNTSPPQQGHNRLSRGGTSSKWCNLSATLHLVLALATMAPKEDVDSSVNTKARCAERYASLQRLYSNRWTRNCGSNRFSSAPRPFTMNAVPFAIPSVYRHTTFSRLRDTWGALAVASRDAPQTTLFSQLTGVLLLRVAIHLDMFPSYISACSIRAQSLLPGGLKTSEKCLHRPEVGRLQWA